MKNDITDITIYHFDRAKQTYTFQNVRGAFQGGIGASFNIGYSEANDIKAWLFYKDNPNLEAISIGDIIVKGKFGEIKSESELKNHFKIQTIINNDYGTNTMQHIQIGAK